MGEFCGLWIELIRVDWCQAVRVGSEWYHLKLGGCLHFLRCGRLQKAMTGIMIARWTRGPGALTPGSHYADHRHPVCVWTCVQCVISAHITASAHPFHSFIVASLGPEQTNTRLCLCRDWSLSRHHTRNIRAPRVISRGLRRYFETTYPGYFLPVSLCVTPALPLSHKEISVAGQKAELGSGANGYYMDPGRGAARQPGLQTRIANARATSTVFLRSNKICSDNPCHGSWQRQQHYAGRSCLDPGEGDEFLSVTGQQWMS